MNERISIAWVAWKAATRFMFWTLVEVVSGAVSAKKEAARNITGLRPATPKEAFAAGYALFVFELHSDAWNGIWRASNDSTYISPMFECRDWHGIPWHRVEFTSPTVYLTSECRAVELKYAQKHLRYNQIFKVAA